MSEDSTKYMTKRLEDLGRAREHLRRILEERYPPTSKHDNFWNPRDDDALKERFEEARLLYRGLHDDLDTLWTILEGEDD